MTSKSELRLLVGGVIIGLLSGLVCIVYRFLLAKIETFIADISILVHQDIKYLIYFALSMIIIGLFINYLIKKESLIGGSGIPQVEAEISGFIRPDHLRVLLCKFFGGIASALGGLSLGREGPSIQLGAMSAMIIGKRLKLLDKDLLLTSGAAAGLASAFSAPLSGVLFSLEELHHNFNTKVLIVVMASAISGDFLASYIFGFEPTFAFMIDGTIPLSLYPLIIILGIICGLIGTFYNKMTILVQKAYAKIPQSVRIFIPLSISIIALYFLPAILGGGHHLLAYIRPDTLITTLIFLFIMKLAFSFISFGSGAPGGIFFPLLVNGALIGAILAILMINIGILDETWFYHFVVLAMAAYFTAIVRAPITGIILIFEMTGNISNLLPLVLASIFAYIIADLLRCKPIYESLIEKYEPKELKEAYELKTIEMVVNYGSDACGKKISDIKWPKGIHIIKIERLGKELIAMGDVMLSIGDVVEISVDKNLYGQIYKDLNQIFEGQK